MLIAAILGYKLRKYNWLVELNFIHKYLLLKNKLKKYVGKFNILAANLSKKDIF
jgi:hypothetical protein